MTRGQVVKALGVSRGTVRRMDGIELHPKLAVNGRASYSEEEVEALAESLRKHGRISPHGLRRGQVAQSLGRSITSVRNMEATGELNSDCINGRHYFDAEEVEVVRKNLLRNGHRTVLSADGRNNFMHPDTLRIYKSELNLAQEENSHLKSELEMLRAKKSYELPNDDPPHLENFVDTLLIRKCEQMG